MRDIVPLAQLEAQLAAQRAEEARQNEARFLELQQQVAARQAAEAQREVESQRQKKQQAKILGKGSGRSKLSFSLNL